MQCIICFAIAQFLFNGSSYCDKHYKEEKLRIEQHSRATIERIERQIVQDTKDFKSFNDLLNIAYPKE